MRDFNLYVVTTEPKNNLSYEHMVEQAILGGADIIQYRDESNRTDRQKLILIRSLREITKKYNVPLIINNRLDLAVIAGADGVHVGQDDIPAALIRRLGEDFIIGLSVSSVDEAMEAEKIGADYIGVGPVFDTPIKPLNNSIGLDLTSKIYNSVKIPVVAIGGIDENNLNTLIEKGIKRVAVVRAVCHREDIKQSARNIKEMLRKF
jgi:thiamine-phosphate pyrophosphorylase